MFGIDDVAGAMIGGTAANLVGNIFNNNQGQRNARDQMNFQATQSATAHQREVNDLKLAGLNPILSANSGASSGNGAMSTPQAPTIDMPSIISAQQNKMALDQKQQQINIDKANSAAGIAKSLSDAELNRTRTLIEKGGFLGRYLGTGGAKVQDYFQNPQGTFRKGIDRINQNSGQGGILNLPAIP